MAAAGSQMHTSAFNRLHNWLQTASGAIGTDAHENRHPDVLFFRFLDGGLCQYLLLRQGLQKLSKAVN